MVKRIMLFVAIVASGAGCGGKQSATAPAETPQAIIKRCATAMHEGDREAFLRCFIANDAEMEALAEFAGFIESMLAFRETFIGTYGKAAWRDFQDPGKAPEDGNATFSLITRTELAEIDYSAIDVSDNTATFSMPGTEGTLTAKRNDGGWLIDATTVLPASDEPRAFGDMMRRLGNVVGTYARAIGHAGITPEDIDAELGRALMKEMSGMSTSAKHRFDIDSL